MKNGQTTSSSICTPLRRGHGPRLHRAAAPAELGLPLPGRVRPGVRQRRQDILQRLPCQLQRQLCKFLVEEMLGKLLRNDASKSFSSPDSMHAKGRAHAVEALESTEGPAQED